jgi:hypothetical protein
MVLTVAKQSEMGYTSIGTFDRKQTKSADNTRAFQQHGSAENACAHRRSAESILLKITSRPTCGEILRPSRPNSVSPPPASPCEVRYLLADPKFSTKQEIATLQNAHVEMK